MLETRDRVSKIKGIGETSEKRFAKLGIITAGDLVMHYPFRYESYAWPVPIKSVQDGQLVSIEGIISRSPGIINTGRYRIIETEVHDDSGSIIIRWYNSPYLLKTLIPGRRHIFRGKAALKNRKYYIYQPEIFTKEKYRDQMKSLKPVYKSTEGLNQAAIRKAIVSCFDELMIKDYLPAKIVKECGLPVLREALSDIHFPKNEEVLGKALRRMVFDEFFFFFVNMQRMKENSVVKPNTHRIGKSETVGQIISGLPYELTGDQKKALEEICADMASEKVMQRLLQGDVGSGKTVVALLALVAVSEAGFQGAIMAPTEVLAEQHYEYFKGILEPKGIGVAFLSGSMTKKQKTAEYERIASGEARIIVGTHAAIQEGVKFENLALAVIDEQHRFGVRQREALELKGEGVHLLLMSATPIPRTYALMLYGGMDISVLAELPKNRLPIKNCVVDTTKRAAINRFLEKEVAKGHQGYVICPLIEESEKLEAAAVREYVAELSVALPKLRIEALDGKMKAAEKNAIMERFAAGDTDILVSTTVIEVGINVPNATVMVIENAERFGLAQLHQIRGRVGRGRDQSYCVFVNGDGSENSEKRLKTVSDSNDGFYVAEQDMKLRGPGDFFGVRQSGDRQFVLADPLRDGEIMAKAKNAAAGLLAEELEKITEERNRLVSHAEVMVY